MFWRIEKLDEACARREDGSHDGRFVLHRHHDAEGPHLDLRLEADGHLAGYRIGADALEDGAWATEKMPHPVSWLERDGDAVREDAGVYAWRHRGADRRELELRGAAGVTVLRFTPERGVDARAARGIAEALRSERADAGSAPGLIRDGALARRRAIERFCALGRELDGRAFDDAAWRRTLAGHSLADLQPHLHALETRFDAKYPPVPTSRPEPLPEDDAGGAAVLALARV
jgi:hypothetical protein